MDGCFSNPVEAEKAMDAMPPVYGGFVLRVDECTSTCRCGQSLNGHNPKLAAQIDKQTKLHSTRAQSTSVIDTQPRWRPRRRPWGKN